MEDLANISNIDFIPEFQPIPFPIPLWLMQTLLVLGFFLHVIPMNVALAGAVIAAIAIFKSKKKKNDNCYRFGQTLAFSLPIFLSFAITQGIVPLLFLQLIYGPLYYTSSIFMAVPWLAVIFVLIAGYYLLYIYKFQHKRLKQYGPFLLIASSIIFTVIAFVFTNNMTLMISPDKWYKIADAATLGMHLNLSEPQLISRFLHFIVGSFAVTGLAIGCFGLYYKQKDPGFSTWLIKKGSSIFTVTTVVQILSGAWFLLSIPREHMLNYMGRDQFGTVIFIGALVLTIVAIVFAIFSWNNGHHLPFTLSLVSGLLVVFLMVVMRHLLRIYATADFLKPELVPVSIQWDILSVFLIGAVLLVAYLIWLSKVAWRAYNA